MPGRLFLERPMGEIANWLGRGDAPEQVARRNIQPGQDVVALSAEGWREMRWGLIPVGRVNARGRPVMETIINARSETVFDKSAFQGVRRAVLPVDGWYEWTRGDAKKDGLADRGKGWRAAGLCRDLGYLAGTGRARAGAVGDGDLRAERGCGKGASPHGGSVGAAGCGDVADRRRGGGACVVPAVAGGAVAHRRGDRCGLERGVSEPAETELTRLLRGVSTGHVETVREAWRALLALGAEAVPPLEAKLDSDAWEAPPKGPAGKYLGVLLALLSDLDSAVFAETIGRLQAGKLHPLHARTVKIMAGRMAEEPVLQVGPGVPVYVADDLPDRQRIAAEIAGWSTTKGLTLDRVSRIDVIGHVPGMDYLGLYNLFFSGIVLVWPGLDFGPGWLRRWSREFTFYHEVGHHACGHAEGGQVIEQEREADTYAGTMMRAAHPVLIPAGRVLFWPLRGWARRRRLRSERLSE